MPQIKQSLVDNNTLFNLDGLDYAKNVYTVCYNNLLVDNTKNIIPTDVGVGIINKYNGSILKSPSLVIDWKDSNGDPYTSLNLLLSDLSNLLGFLGGGSVGPNFNITQKVESFSEFIPGSAQGEIGYSENSQGTPWLPGNIGGTYYPSGWYVWNDSEWVSDRNAIANQLEDLILNKADINEVYTKSESDSMFLTQDGDGSQLTDVDANSLIRFNLGSSDFGSQSSDINNNTMVSGIYRISASTTGNPIGSSGILYHFYTGATGYVAQLAHFINAVDINRMFIRHYTPNLSDWTTWTEVLHTGNTAPTTFANLPTSPSKGDIRSITDASVVSYRSIASGGGTNAAIVLYDGLNWVYS